jgi:hypothetical protein
MSLLKRALWVWAVIMLSAGQAWAVPAFARQTGMSCAQCHTQFPELTPFGRQFKLNGYVLGAKDKIVDSTPAADGKDEDADTKLEIGAGVPLGAMVQAEMHWVRNDAAKDSSTTASSGSDGQGYAGMPTQFSLFYAGEIAPKAGAFVQLTYDPGSGVMHIDNTDLRAVTHVSLGSHDLIVGGTMNNNITAQDIYNTTPAWGFPYAAPDGDTSPSPTVSPQLMGAMAQNEAGMGAYLDLDSWLYTELSFYRSNPQAGYAGPYMQGWSPYWRVAAELDRGNHSLEVGAFGTTMAVHPSGDVTAYPNVNGQTVNNIPSDIYTDVAADLQYQYIGDKNIVTLMGTWMNENQALNFSHPSGLADNQYDNLQALRFSAEYLYDRAWGASVAYMQTTGGNDATLYQNAGLAQPSPDSNGILYEVSYRPWLNTRLSLDYQTYGKFDGENSNYAAVDPITGRSRSAADNNTTTLMAWMAY